MTILSALQLLVLGFMIAGLVAVILEIAVKSPRAFGEIATDTARFAAAPNGSLGRSLETAPARAVRPRHGTADSVAAAEDRRRAA